MIVTWCPTLSKKIPTLQNKVIRVIHFKGKQEHVEDLYKSSNIMKITNNVGLLNTLLAHDCLNGKLPKSFDNFINLKSSTIGTRTSECDILKMPNVRTKQFGSQTVKIRCIIEWNKFHKTSKENNLAIINRLKLKDMYKRIIT